MTIVYIKIFTFLNVIRILYFLYLWGFENDRIQIDSVIKAQLPNMLSDYAMNIDLPSASF